MYIVHCYLMCHLFSDLSFIASSLLKSSAGLMPGFLVVLQFFAFSWASLKLKEGGGGGGGGEGIS